MDQKEFKESLIEGIKENFDERGVEGMSFNDRGGVDKLNGGYDGVVITPEGSNIGVTLNVDALFEAYENGATMMWLLMQLIWPSMALRISLRLM